MGYSKTTEEQCCFTGLHFTEQDICIQSLRPNHYEEHSTDESRKPLSSFVTSIISSRPSVDEEECCFVSCPEDSASISNILRDITNDAMSEPNRYTNFLSLLPQVFAASSPIIDSSWCAWKDLGAVVWKGSRSYISVGKFLKSCLPFMKENMPQPDIKALERKLVSEKEWKYGGEVRASSRPINSLVGMDIEFETNLINVPISKDDNSDIFKYICQRFREKTFDNYEFKAPESAVKEEIYDVEPVENNREIFQLYEKIEKEIRGMLDYGSID